MNCSQKLRILLEAAENLHMHPSDVRRAKELFEYDEPLLCFDIVAQQLYEYSIEITTEFYEIMKETAHCLSINEDEYSFNKELIRDDTQVPVATAKAIAVLLYQIKNKL